MTRKVLLDETGVVTPAEGFTVVTDDVTFLEQINAETNLFVRGHHLTQWANTLALVRGWDARHVQDPVLEIQSAVPGLSNTEAREILQQLGDDYWNLASQMDADSIARALLPSDLWSADETTSEHAADWLIWLAEGGTESLDERIVSAASRRWRLTGADTWAERCYSAGSSQQALDILEEWLVSPRRDLSWPEFPKKDIPTNVSQQLLDRFEQELEQSPEQVIKRLQGADLAGAIARPLVRACAQYVRRNPESLRLHQHWLRWFRGYLTETEVSDIEELIPPSDPGLPPIEIDQSVTWFITQYLPWKRWAARQSGSEVASRASDIGSQFGNWYLETLSKAMQGGQGMNRLAWMRSRKLPRDGSEGVTLFVVLDGLGHTDVPALLQNLQREAPRLTVESNEVVFTPVPTITELTKDSLVTGRSPADARQSDSSATVQSYTHYSGVKSAVASAKAGSVIVWRHEEPDRTYHQVTDYESLVFAVESRLTEIAKQISALVEVGPEHLEFRTVISTDHGRYLGYSTRSIDVPDGYVSHGRAAWGTPGYDVSERGFAVENGVAYLDASTFRLPPESTYAVSMSDRSFVTSDGRTGTEWCPHGGIYPEEVYVPWITSKRDIRIQNLQAALWGTGESHGIGQLVLSVANPNAFNLRLLAIEIEYSGVVRSIELGRHLEPHESTEMRHALDNWPTNAEVSTSDIRVTYSTPDQQLHSVLVTAELTSESLYETTDILGDLEP